jgi:hypothetical protein
MLDAERIERERLSEEQLLSYHQREMEFMAQVGGGGGGGGPLGGPRRAEGRARRRGRGPAAAGAAQRQAPAPAGAEAGASSQRWRQAPAASGRAGAPAAEKQGRPLGQRPRPHQQGPRRRPSRTRPTDAPPSGLPSPLTPRKVVFVEASRRAGRTIDRVVTIMDASGLTFSSLTGFAQRVGRRGGGPGAGLPRFHSPRQGAGWPSPRPRWSPRGWGRDPPSHTHPDTGVVIPAPARARPAAAWRPGRPRFCPRPASRRRAVAHTQPPPSTHPPRPVPPPSCSAPSRLWTPTTTPRPATRSS